MQRYHEAAEAFRGCGDVVSEATRLLRLVEWTETRVILQKKRPDDDAGLLAGMLWTVVTKFPSFLPCTRPSSSEPCSDDEKTFCAVGCPEWTVTVGRTPRRISGMSFGTTSRKKTKIILCCVWRTSTVEVWTVRRVSASWTTRYSCTDS